MQPATTAGPLLLQEASSLRRSREKRKLNLNVLTSFTERISSLAKLPIWVANDEDAVSSLCDTLMDDRRPAFVRTVLTETRWAPLILLIQSAILIAHKHKCTPAVAAIWKAVEHLLYERSSVNAASFPTADVKTWLEKLVDVTAKHIGLALVNRAASTLVSTLSFALSLTATAVDARPRLFIRASRATPSPTASSPTTNMSPNSTNSSAPPTVILDLTDSDAEPSPKRQRLGHDAKTAYVQRAPVRPIASHAPRRHSESQTAKGSLPPQRLMSESDEDDDELSGLDALRKQKEATKAAALQAKAKAEASMSTMRRLKSLKRDVASAPKAHNATWSNLLKCWVEELSTRELREATSKRIVFHKVGALVWSSIMDRENKMEEKNLAPCQILAYCKVVPTPPSESLSSDDGSDVKVGDIVACVQWIYSRRHIPSNVINPEQIDAAGMFASNWAIADESGEVCLASLDSPAKIKITHDFYHSRDKKQATLTKRLSAVFV